MRDTITDVTLMLFENTHFRGVFRTLSKNSDGTLYVEIAND